MKNLHYLLSGFLIVALIGCSENDYQNPNKKVIGTGPVVTQTLNLPAFSKIENTGVANIYVTTGNPQSVILKAQQNIIDVLTIEVINNTLKIGIEENTSIENTIEIRFDIIVSEVSDIGILGVGNYELNGDFQDELFISLTGVGNINAYDLEVGSCTIVSTGVGDCKVNVRDELDVSITGVGNVLYRGNPTITQNITGVGNVINDNWGVLLGVDIFIFITKLIRKIQYEYHWIKSLAINYGRHQRW